MQRNHCVRRGENFRFVLAAGRYLVIAGTKLKSEVHGCGAVRVHVAAGKSVTQDVATGCRVP
jgi:hypothetical protein